MTDQPPALRLYEAVMAALRTQGMTKVQLHQRSGVARSTVDDWRTQSRPPQGATVRAVAQAVGMDQDEALRLAGLLPARAEPPASLREVPTDDLLAEIRRRIPD